jgi:hypothetical protein
MSIVASLIAGDVFIYLLLCRICISVCRLIIICGSAGKVRRGIGLSRFLPVLCRRSCLSVVWPDMHLHYVQYLSVGLLLENTKHIFVYILVLLTCLLPPPLYYRALTLSPL